MADKAKKGCADKAELKALAADPGCAGLADVAAHVWVCEDCRRAFEDVLYPPEECALDAADRAAIDRVVAARCRRADTLEERLSAFLRDRQAAILDSVDDFRLAAASGRAGGTAAATSAGEEAEDVTFVFASEACAPDARAWRAELTVPGTAGADASLPLRVTGAGGEAAEGLFRLAGVALPLVDGGAELPLPLFLSGMKDSRVDLTFADGWTERGCLVFV